MAEAPVDAPISSIGSLFSRMVLNLGHGNGVRAPSLFLHRQHARSVPP
eukprot:CAMPEP_0185273522 /NCGR_PEP_ID=MMETSP1359-20130426/49742_1 /TAXON_ID=552665 /ORGANISM="Bigelowiella longifila, Strain CCMP242" /LENGTH=47 /DNA_ID= /DNA_START= /DNA_END= /DNA_ORIENTATION=